jgi:N-ethylmaleimide reductase
MSESDPFTLYAHLVEQLNAFNLAYIHVVERFGISKSEDKAEFDFAGLRQIFNGQYIANGGYSGETAEQSLQAGESDFIAFGVPFIANPDLPKRIQLNAELNAPDPDTFYGGDEKGYTDYPLLEE